MGRGFGISADVDLGVVREVAGEAEALGYTSFWVNDLPHADGLTALAAAAAVTTSIELGVGVIPLDRRPAARILGDLDAAGLPEGRLLLGVGSGGSHEALERVRAGLAELLETTRARRYVGALGPRMALLGGEAAEGVLLNWLTPEHAERTAEDIRAAAEVAGNRRPSTTAYVRCGLLPGAAEGLRRELRWYVGVATFERHLARMGATAEQTCVLGEGAAAIQAGLAPYEAVLDETVVRAVTGATESPAEDLLALLEAARPGR